MATFQISDGLRLAAMACAVSAVASCAESAKDHADRNGDGRLSNQEVEYALTEAVFLKSDVNGDGTVTFVEWQKIYPDAKQSEFLRKNPSGKNAYTFEDTLAVFQKDKVFDRLIAKIDTDSNGYIDEKEAGVFWDAYAVAPGGNEVQKLGSMTK